MPDRRERASRTAMLPIVIVLIDCGGGATAGGAPGRSVAGEGHWRSL